MKRFTCRLAIGSGCLVFGTKCWLLFFLALGLPVHVEARAISEMTEKHPAVRVLASDRNGIEIEVFCRAPCEPVVAFDSLTTFSISVAGFQQDCTPGGPCLPVKGMALAIPARSMPLVNILEKRTREIDVPCAPGDPLPEYLSVPVSIGHTGLVRDLRVAQVLIRPIVTARLGTGLKVYEYLRFRVEFSSGLEDDGPSRGGDDPLDPLLRSLVVNPEQVEVLKLARRSARSGPNLLQVPVEKYKLRVGGEGIYRVTGSELIEAGMDIESVDPRKIHLENLGKRVPVYVSGDGDGEFNEEDYVEFYGEGPRGDFTYMSMYAVENVYWLFSDDSLGLPLVEEDGGLAVTDPSLLELPSSYDFQVHAEVESWFERLPDDTMHEQDVWFWDMVSASEQGIKEFPIALASPDLSSGDTLSLRLGLQGLSHHASIEPDHHALVYVNGALAGGTYWDGQHTHLFDAEDEGTGLENNVLRESGNSVSLVMPGDTPAGSDDRVLVNWIEVRYKRLYRATDDYIRFSKPLNGRYGTYQFTVEGFSTPEISVYKLGKSKLVNLSIEPVILFGDTTYQAVFQTEIISDDVEFVALSESRRESVASLEKDEPSLLRSPLNGADIIVIAHDSLASVADEYVSYRQAQGYRVMMARVSDIYDEFSWGVRDAKAIKEFLEYAYSSWTTPSCFSCVLIGDGSSDDRNLRGMGGNLIPVHLERSIYSGLVASDNWYACVSGDDFLPDIAISRIPAVDGQVLTGLLDKLRATEQASVPGAWKGKVLHVAGSDGGNNLTFRELMEDTIVQVHSPIWVEAERVYAERDPGMDPDPYYGGKEDLLTRLNEGVSVVQYFGHGSGGTWSNPYLLTPEDVPLLENSERLPLVASFTCFTSVFDQPTRWSLGEALVLEPGGGAIGVIGATALGYFWEDIDVAHSFNRVMYRDPPGTIGELFLRAKLDYAFGNYGGYATTMIKCQTLLGDGASRFLLPPSDITVTVLPRSVEAGDSITVSLSVGTQEPDSALVTLSDSMTVYAETTIPISQSKGNAEFEIPSGVRSGMSVARAYVWDLASSYEGVGAAEFSVASPGIFMVRTEPEIPGPADTVHVRAGVHYAPGIDSVALQWARSRSPVTWSRIPMLIQAGDTFRTQSAIPVQTPDKPVCYRVVAYGSDGKKLESGIQCYPVLEKPNLLLVRKEDLFLSGIKRVEVSAKIFNSGDVDVDSCPVLFRALADSSIIGSGWTRVPALEYGQVSAPWTVSGARWDVYVEIDPDSIVDESIETDNTSIGFPTRIVVDRFNVTRESGTGGPVQSVDSNLVCSIPPDAVQDSTVLLVEAAVPHSTIQPAMKFAALPGKASGSAYTLSFVDSLVSLVSGGSAQLTLRFDSSDSLNRQERELLGIYRYNAASLKWTQRGGSVDSASIDLEIGELGEYAVLRSGDSEPPLIKVSVKDQAFASGDYVPASPSISLMLSDENGVDVERGLLVLVDGSNADPGSYVCPRDPADGNEVQASFYPELEDGHHQLVVTCWDCSGNSASKEFDVLVQSDFGIRGLGNYPNPVRSNETVFAFSLTGVADEAELRIYTSSGRLIRSFTRGRWWDLSDIGYHEVPWNLADECGMPVANGVYFYVLRVKKENDVHREKGKLAVLR